MSTTQSRGGDAGGFFSCARERGKEARAVVRRAGEGWREGFLEALGRTGNVRMAAQSVGIDHNSAYNLRRAEAGFAGAFEQARLWGQARVAAGGSAAAGDVDLNADVGGDPAGRTAVRISRRDGAQLVRAGEGRMSAADVGRFLAHLRWTGNVRMSAAAAGFSTTAFYKRCKKDRKMAQQWAAAREQGCRRISELLVAAAEAALDPSVEAPEGMPEVSVAEAIAILKLHRFDLPGAPSKRDTAARGGGGEGRWGAAWTGEDGLPPIEAVRDEVLRRLAVLRAHRDAQAAGEEEAG